MKYHFPILHQCRLQALWRGLSIPETSELNELPLTMKTDLWNVGGRQVLYNLILFVLICSTFQAIIHLPVMAIHELNIQLCLQLAIWWIWNSHNFLLAERKGIWVWPAGYYNVICMFSVLTWVLDSTVAIQTNPVHALKCNLFLLPQSKRNKKKIIGTLSLFHRLFRSWPMPP